MNILQIKKEMVSYVDYFGGDLDRFKIDQAKTLKELNDIIDDHYDKLSDMANDAQNSLDRFRRKLGLGKDLEEENISEYAE